MISPRTGGCPIRFASAAEQPGEHDDQREVEQQQLDVGVSHRGRSCPPSSLRPARRQRPRWDS